MILTGTRIKAYWQGGGSLEGTVIHVPQDTGDMWHIKDDSGNIHIINHMASHFESFVITLDERKGTG